MTERYCQAIYGDGASETFFCCRYEGHPGDHEEWRDKEGDPTTPLKGRMSFAWPAEIGSEAEPAGAPSPSQDGSGNPDSSPQGAA